VLLLQENVFKIFVKINKFIVMTENVLKMFQNVQLDQSVLTRLQFFVLIINV